MNNEIIVMSAGSQITVPRDPEQLLDQQVWTADYQPQGYPLGYFATNSRPAFAQTVINEMLTDPTINYGLWLIKGPIVSNTKFEIECTNPAVKTFLQKNLYRFWANSALRVLKAIEWGYSGSEVTYRVLDGQIHFDCVRDLHSEDIRVITNKGQLCGITVKGVPLRGGQKSTIFLGGMKGLLHLHWRDRSTWYGLSRLFSAYIPWWEKWSSGGYRDIRRLWYFKNAYEGGTIYHPPGSTRLENGMVVPNKVLARELIEKKRTGGILTLPNGTGADNLPQWRYEPPASNSAPDGLLDYGDKLDIEELQAMGIPPEIVESQGNQGFGSSSGRQVPQTAFYASLTELAAWAVYDFDFQVLKPLVALNFSAQDANSYEIITLPLNENGGGESEGFNGNQFVDDDLNAPNPNDPNAPEQDEDGVPVNEEEEELAPPQ